jgi:hypothetical protein
MTLFTAIMVVDIYTFGYKWHSLGTKRFPGAGKEYEIFGAVGRAVLIAIGLLIAIGWFLVSGCCS